MKLLFALALLFAVTYATDPSLSEDDEKYFMSFNRDATQYHMNYVTYTGEIPDVKDLYTISMWLNPCGTGRDMTVFDYRHAGVKNAYVVKLDKDNKLHVHAANYHTKANEKLPDFEDTHVMLVMDTVGAKCIYIWLNGTKVHTGSVAANKYNGFKKEGRMVFGSGYEKENKEDIQWDKQYVGTIANWKLFKGKLTDAQIQSVVFDKEPLEDLTIMEPSKKTMEVKGCYVDTYEPTVYEPYSMVFDRDATEDRMSYVKYTGTIPDVEKLYTISMWLNPNSTGKAMTVFDYRHSGVKNAYVVKLDKNNKLHVHAANYHTKANTKIPDNADTHVMLVMDTVGAKCIYIWLNGKKVHTGSVAANKYNGFKKEGRIVFGSGFQTEASEDVQWNKQYVGKISAWKLYKGKLTDDQIQSVYTDKDRLDDLNLMEPRSTNMKTKGCDVVTRPVDDVYQYISADLTNQFFNFVMNW